MFYNMGFGAFEPTATYAKITVPAAVLNFLNGSYANGVWTKSLPAGREIEDYETRMKFVIDQAKENFVNFKGGDVTLKEANKISSDINAFRRYMQVKKQVEKGWLTMEATNWFYSNYFGSYETYKKFDEWISRQSSEALNELMDNANLQMSTVKSGMTMAKIDFYNNVIVPLANKFSQSDQQFLRDIFVMKMDGEVSLSDLNKALKMLSPLITDVQYATVYQFAYQMILGPNLASDVLNAKVTASYGARNINNELAQIQAQYNAVASRLRPYLSADTDALMVERLKIWKAGYEQPSNPEYYVCGAVCNQIMSNLMSPIGPILDANQKLTKKVGGSNATPEKSVEELIREQVLANGGTESDVQALLNNPVVQDQLNQHQIEIDEMDVNKALDEMGSNKNFMWLLLAAGAYFLFKGSK